MPSATWRGREVRVSGNSFSFELHLFNKADEPDTFRLSAALDAERRPVGDRVSFEEDVITLAGGEHRVVRVTCDVSGASGRHVLWLRADSARAAAEGQPTGYIEIPLLLNIRR